MTKTKNTDIKSELPEYFKQYLDEKFEAISIEISEVKEDVAFIKADIKKNYDCLIECKSSLGTHSVQIKHIFQLCAFIIIVLILGVLGGVELITKGILSFIK